MSQSRFYVLLPHTVQVLVADGADPVGALDVVLPAGLAHPGLADLAKRAPVDDSAQLRSAAAARPAHAGRVRPKPGLTRLGMPGARIDPEGALLLEHG